jgi:hypothetical protein
MPKGVHPTATPSANAPRVQFATDGLHGNAHLAGRHAAGPGMQRRSASAFERFHLQKILH